MNLPQNMKFDLVEWEDDEEGWTKWCEGRLGVPWVDAGMRQINAEAYMHNRLRMNVASYLRANLLIDYRRGERYFAEHLIDWDLSNNTNGWEPSKFCCNNYYSKMPLTPLQAIQCSTRSHKQKNVTRMATTFENGCRS